MKIAPARALFISAFQLLSISAFQLNAQTIFVPNGTVGTSSTTGVGIGTASPIAKLDITTNNAKRIVTEIVVGQPDYSYYYLKLFEVPTGLSNDTIVINGKIAGYRSNDLGVSASSEMYVSRGYNSTIYASQVVEKEGYSPFQVVQLTDGGRNWVALLYDAHSGAGILSWHLDVAVYNTSSADALSLTAIQSNTPIHTTLSRLVYNMAGVAGGPNQLVAGYQPASEAGIADFVRGGMGWEFSRPSDGAFAHGIFSYDDTASRANLAVTARNDLVFAAGDGLAAAPERMRITDVGNVGIGTPTPGQKLDVTGAIRSSVSGGSGLILSKPTGSSIQFDDGVVADALIEAGTGLNSPRLEFWTSSGTGGSLTERMRIDNAGNVGIGTPTPGAKLDVAGDARVSGNLTILGSFTAPAYTASSGTLTGGASGLTVNAGGTNQNVTISPSGAGATILNGNVGVGTTPTYKLQIAGNNAGQPQVPDFSLDTNAWFNFGHDTGYGYIGWFTQGTGTGFVNTHSSVSPTLIRASNGALTIYSSTSTGFGNPSNFFPELSVTATGVAIGTATADTALTVKGTIHASEVVVDAKVTANVIQTNDVRVQPKAWADDVFDEGRPLQSLSDVEQSIKEHKHLPGVPSAREVAANGVSVADMQTVLLQKIEELTLHQIEQEKQLRVQGAEIKELRRENVELRSHGTQ